MDPTPLQQTVMESPEVISHPQEVDLGAPASPTDPPTTPNADQAYEPLSYDELFPALPTAGVTQTSASEVPQDNWMKHSDMRIASTVITQVFRVPYEERAKIDGNSQFGESASSRICADITSRTGAHIEISSAKDQSLTFLVTGKNEAVTKARRLVLDKFQTQARHIIKIPKDHHRFILGKKGKKLQDLEMNTASKIQVPNSKDNSDEIIIVGTREGIEKAVHEIQLISDEQVHVEFTDKQGGINLEGPPEEVEKAREKLENMIAEMQSKLCFEEITVDPKFYKHIIGKSGSNINRIRNDTGVLINISEADGSSLIRLEGSPEGVSQAKKELEELVTKMENEKERDIVIEQRFHRTVIGTKGDKIKEIRDKFNQVQISFPDPGEQSDVVKIRGPKDDVDHCYTYLKKVSRDLIESSYQVKVSIFRQFHKFIIGKGGANINKIREETSTRIDLPSEGQNSDEITITGKKENCEKARERIQKIQDELASIVEVDIIIPAKFHNSMIGAGGKLIQSISEDCGGVAIKFPPPEKSSDKVTIRGPKEDVYKAKQILVDLSNEKQLASYTTEVRARQQHHRFLIGRNGANIRKIRDATGARIIFPTEKDEDKELITIMGKKESIALAKEQLEAIIKELDLIVEDTMTVDPKHHRHFVARRGEVLRQIAEQYGGVTVSFPRSGVQSDRVTLKGAKECVEGAKARIQEIVNDLDEMVHIEVIIPQKYHRTVMGARGSKVQAITTEFEVQIKFPEKDGYYVNGEDGQAQVNGDVDGEGEVVTRPQDIVHIVGKKDKCEAARAALLNLVPVTVEENVAFRHHRYIIGQKGENVRNMMTDYDVNIQVPPAQEQSDIIRITGPPAHTERAREALREKVRQLEDEELDRQARSFHICVEVDPEYHPKIIGRRGAVISKIREKHEVNIQFPPRGDPKEHIITITGYEKNVNEAKAAILAITGELDKMVKYTVELDSRVHSRLIGSRGRAIKKVMEEFKVEIKFPRGDDDPNLVTIMGAAEDVEECKDHLLNLMEEYMQDIVEKEDLEVYMTPKPSPVSGETSPGGLKRNEGFVVSGAPWAQEAPNMNSSEDFPSMGAPVVTHAAPTIWGPRR
ncbi:vigilin isoform X3 [Panulirus ornatus]|uniref:vigilin isoform X3 n=1 Tax=Panulirus ornatus TaxID=150431 RepID=UPI003A8AC76F